MIQDPSPSGKATETRNETSPLPWGIVLAGGSGVRLQSLTRRLEGAPVPKQFCKFGGRRSLLQETLFRIRPCIAPDRTLVVANSSYLHVARAQLEAAPGTALVEQPMNRGTAAGILLPLVHALRRDPAASVVVFPSDHGIADLALFRAGLAMALRAVEGNPLQIVVGGVAADTPNTEYGWLVPDAPLEPTLGPCLGRIRCFVEKPSPEEAKDLLACRSLWSTFILVAKARTLLALFRRELPEIADFFATYAALEEKHAKAWLEARYADLPPADFSADLLAKAADLTVLAWPAELGWTDLGTPQRVVEWISRQAGATQMPAEEILASVSSPESFEG